MSQDSLARDATHQDLFGTPEQYALPVLLWATAGWDGEASVEDLGGPGNEGRTLARVTLYSGKPPGLAVKAGQAQGHQALVQILGPLFAIPPAGTQVLCAFPEGDTTTPGNGAIIGWAQASPTESGGGSIAPLFGAGCAMLDVGANTDLVLRGRTATLLNGNGLGWLSVGPITVFPTANVSPAIYGPGGPAGVASTMVFLSP